MKGEKVFTGLTFIFIGVIFLLDNLHVIDFHWSAIWRLWPLFLVMAGVNLLFANSDSATATGIRALVLVAGLVLVFIRGTQPREHRWSFNFNDRERDGSAWNDDSDDEEGKDKRSLSRVSASSTFTEDYTPTVKVAKLFVAGGGTEYYLKDSDSTLFSAVTDEVFGRYSLNRDDSDSVTVLNFKMQDKGRNWKFDNKRSNEVHMRLNTNPLWDIDVKAGATNAEFDLTPFRVRSFVFHGGAASVNVRIGDKSTNTNVRVESGVASVNIKIPQASGCRIVSQGGLSSRDFSGFTKKGDGAYETDNYATAANKVNMTLKGGVSSFDVEKY